jgi:hypothetical protein
MLITSVLSAAVAHACSDLSAMKAVVQTPCDHHQKQNEPPAKTDEQNCDAIRYGMLSIQSSRFQTDIFKHYSITLDYALILTNSPSESLLWFARSLVPFSLGAGVSPRLSHVVLRI